MKTLSVRKGCRGHDNMLEELRQGGADNAVSFNMVACPTTSKHPVNMS